MNYARLIENLLISILILFIFSYEKISAFFVLISFFTAITIIGISTNSSLSCSAGNKEELEKKFKFLIEIKPHFLKLRLSPYQFLEFLDLAKGRNPVFLIIFASLVYYLSIFIIPLLHSLRQNYSIILFLIFFIIIDFLRGKLFINIKEKKYFWKFSSLNISINFSKIKPLDKIELLKSDRVFSQEGRHQMIRHYMQDYDIKFYFKDGKEIDYPLFDIETGKVIYGTRTDMNKEEIEGWIDYCDKFIEEKIKELADLLEIKYEGLNYKKEETN